MSKQRTFERFIHKAPFAVMTRLVAGAFIADELDEVFEQHRERQYTRDVKFSALLLGMIVGGLNFLGKHKSKIVVR